MSDPKKNQNNVPIAMERAGITAMLAGIGILPLAINVILILLGTKKRRNNLSLSTAINPPHRRKQMKKSYISCLIESFLWFNLLTFKTRSLSTIAILRSPPFLSPTSFQTKLSP
jgi:hypothetical protein